MFLTGAAVVLCFALAWIIQYSLTYFQMQRFYKRLAFLRHDGQVWIGMAGSAWKRRQYAVLVVDPENHIIHAEQLSGWTILACLKPVSGLTGRPLSDLFDDSIQLPVSKKLLLALRNSAKYILDAAEKKAKEVSKEDKDPKGLEKSLLTE
jgi:DNA-binding transcriptional regulator of glucitol operon